MVGIHSASVQKVFSNAVSRLCPIYSWLCLCHHLPLCYNSKAEYLQQRLNGPRSPRATIIWPLIESFVALHPIAQVSSSQGRQAFTYNIQLGCSDHSPRTVPWAQGEQACLWWSSLHKWWGKPAYKYWKVWKKVSKSFRGLCLNAPFTY